VHIAPRFDADDAAWPRPARHRVGRRERAMGILNVLSKVCIRCAYERRLQYGRKP